MTFRPRPSLPGYVLNLPPPPAAPPEPPPVMVPFVAATPPPDGVGLETDSRSFPFAMSGELEQDVFATSRRWKAIDVFVQANPVAAAFHGEVTIFIYAVNSGVRALVASGRVNLRDVSNFGTPLRLGVWAAGARATATKFLVTWQFTDPLQVLLVAQEGAISISCVASDVSDPVPDGVGEVMHGPDSAVPLGSATNASSPRLELLRFSASNGAAAPRYVHLYDRIAITAPATYLGLTPLFVWSMPAGIGQSIIVPKVSFRARGALRLIVSTTELTTTAAADSSICAVCR